MDDNPANRLGADPLPWAEVDNPMDRKANRTVDQERRPASNVTRAQATKAVQPTTATGRDGNTPPNNGDGEPSKRGRCPVCRETTTVNYRPFCSKRCADLDLGRWLTGSYAVPGGPIDDEDGISQNSGQIGRIVEYGPFDDDDTAKNDDA